MKGIIVALFAFFVLAVSATACVDAGETAVAVVESAPVEVEAAPRVFKRSRTRSVVVEESAPQVSGPRVGFLQRLFSRRQVSETRNVEIKREVRSRGSLFSSRSVSRGVCKNGRCGN